MNKHLILLILFVGLSIETQYVPIPKTPVGIPFGNLNGKINI